MRNLLSTFFCLIFLSSVYGSVSVANAQTTYNMLLEYDMQTNFGITTNYKSQLYCNPTAALFIYQDERKEDINNSNMESFSIEHFKADSTQYFIRTNSELLSLARSEDKEGAYILLSEIVPQIEWHLESEFKNIDGYECAKATCTFRGRDYTAWYAPEIPLHYGPYKFHGLPGAIFELSDSKQEVRFLLKRVRIEEGLTLPMELKEDYPIVPREQYKKSTKEKYEKVKRALSSRADRNMTISVTSFKVHAIEMD